MADYLSPAVYVEEVSSGIKPLQGVGTSTAGFVGLTVKGPIGIATPINNFGAFVTQFGSYSSNALLPFAVKAFFDEGGQTCYVVRTCHYDNTGQPTAVAANRTYNAVAAVPANHPGLRIAANSPGVWGNALAVLVRDVNATGAIDSATGYPQGATLIDFDGVTPGAEFTLGDVLQTGGQTYSLTGNAVADETGAVRGAGIDPPLRAAAANNDAVTFQPAGGWFRIQVFENGTPAETYDGLSMDVGQMNYVATRINNISPRITVTDLAQNAPAIAGMADRRPVQSTSATVPDPLTNGDDGLSGILPADYVGSPAVANGLNAFNTLDDVNILAVPEAVDRSVHVQGMAYCRVRQDCVYIADCQPTIATADDVLAYKTGDGIFAGGNAISSKYGALYAPWVQVFDPRSGGTIFIPPSGLVAGRLAGVDGTRGVHKAAAGIIDGALSTALGLAFNFATPDQEKLNPKGINLIRNFAGTGPVIWGARTVSSDAEWRYLNVRRLFIFLRQSILQGTTWVVFEPNDPTLWKSISRNIAAFLALQWRAGALVGATADEAFYVKCDAETNPPELVELGRVITEIGVAPSKPAEFVIFRVTQMEGGSASSA